jgi:plastocyanin
MTRTRMVLATVGAIVLGVTSCGDDDSGGGTTPPAASASTTSAGGGATTSAGGGGATTPAGGEASIKIADLAFPPETHAKAGATIKITNNDSVTHTVTADDGSFNVEVPGGKTVDLIAPAAGTYPFHCNIHSFMHGTLVVE